MVHFIESHLHCTENLFEHGLDAYEWRHPIFSLHSFGDILQQPLLHQQKVFM